MFTLRTMRNRSQHKNEVRDFVIEWYADDDGVILCKVEHVFVRRIEPPSKSSKRSAQLVALVSRAQSSAQSAR